MGFDENDPLSKTFVSAFIQALAELGWTDGRTVRMDLRWFGGDANRIRALAQELVGLQPDIILANSTPVTATLRLRHVADPVRQGGFGDLAREARLVARPVAEGGAEAVDRELACPRLIEGPGKRHHALRRGGKLTGEYVPLAILARRELSAQERHGGL